jgi:hypothetical protein
MGVGPLGMNASNHVLSAGKESKMDYWDWEIEMAFQDYLLDHWEELYECW